jgi:hypothetical protein
MASLTSPIIIAHRGERILSPENTISAGKLALEQGATGLEVDVRMCAQLPSQKIKILTVPKTELPLPGSNLHAGRIFGGI